jgi:hypothetical protein
VTSRWTPGPLIAWTESDGPGPVPPAAPRRLMFASAAALGVALFAVLTANTVCPEHALWIDGLATATVILVVAAVTTTLLASVLAPVLTLAACSGGMAIAAIDAVHGVTRSRLIALACAIAGGIAAFSVVKSARIRRWEASALAPAGMPSAPDLRANTPDVASGAPSRVADEVARTP